MNERINEDGCYESSEVRVSRQVLGTQVDYLVLAGSDIIMESTDIAIANGVAATLAKLTPRGQPFDRKQALDSLRDLVAGRHFLAAVIEREAESLGAMASAVLKASKRLHGSW